MRRGRGVALEKISSVLKTALTRHLKTQEALKMLCVRPLNILRQSSNLARPAAVFAGSSTNQSTTLKPAGCNAAFRCHSSSSKLKGRLVTTTSHCQLSTSGVLAQTISDVQARDDHLSVTAGNHTIQASYMWLRDHCRCKECYEETCHQNFVDIASLSANIRPTNWSGSGDTLSLTWPDGHVTTYSLDWLRSNAPGQKPETKRPEHFLWDREKLERNLPEDVPLSALREGEGLRKVLENLHVHGFTFVSGLEASREGTEEALHLISAPVQTFYGAVFEYQGEGAIADTGYTNVGLKNHTDTIYFQSGVGGLVLHCIHHDGSGGENTIVDGFHVVQRLKELHPEHYETLSRFPIVGHYLDETHNFCCRHTVLKHDVLTGEMEQLRFNPHDRKVLQCDSYQDADAFYAAYRALGAMIDDPVNEFRTKLEPGRMIVFDNWRMLHGRKAFTGKRVMVGCYYSRDDLQNLKRSVAKMDV